MQPRINNPATLLPDAVKGVNLIYKAAFSSGIDHKVLELAHLRTSQINGCSVCVDIGVRNGKKSGETDERLFAVSAWRETPYFTDAERAALELAEAMTRQADKGEVVTDEVWEGVAKHFDEKQLAALVLWIATTNFFNRINAATRQMAPADWS